MYSSLESIINDVAFKIVQHKVFADKGKIDDILGVLASNGVYAMWVYIKSKYKNEEGKLMNELKPIFKKIAPDKFKDNNDFESFFKDIADDLSLLLFVKDILERTLSYARYHAKAMEDSK